MEGEIVGSSSDTPVNRKTADREEGGSEERCAWLQVCSLSSHLRLWVTPRLWGRTRWRQPPTIRKKRVARSRVWIECSLEGKPGRWGASQSGSTSLDETTEEKSRKSDENGYSNWSHWFSKVVFF